jgi:signal transduction histidine kinase
VDDCRDDCALYRRALQKDCPGLYEIEVCHSGAEGLTRYRAGRPDAVILDYSLPDMEGTEFLQAISRMDGDAQDAPAPPILVSTGQGNEEIAVSCLRLGATDYVVKDKVTGQALHRAITTGLKQRGLELRLREKQAELEHFAFVAAHDLRAPLQKINSFCEMLQMRCRDLDGESKEILGRVTKNADRMRRLVDDLLTYARATRVVPQRIELDEAASIAIANLEVVIRDAGATVQADPLPTVEGDGAALVLLFQNLISNAVKFRLPDTRPEVRITARSDGDRWEITVRDNGIGIAEADRERIFRPLERVHSRDQYDGNGLGLATCRRVVDHHRGRIWVDDPQGGGTVIRFTLPAAAKDIPAAA